MAGIREWWRRGSALIWLSGSALALSILMITGLVGYIAAKGLGFFWPHELVQIQTSEGPVLGQITGQEEAHGDTPAKVQFRVGNRDLYGQDYRWVGAEAMATASRPNDAVLVERLEYGAFIGRIQSLQRQGATQATGWAALEQARSLIHET